jgi:hypothetical protein
MMDQGDSVGLVAAQLAVWLAAALAEQWQAQKELL